ncbi:TM2 domain-containing protein [Streptococcus danieliae]|nr:TM2 domain-containing protein [Streptococcus danieliae]
MKKNVNPLYGKKGMGLINNPKKAVYNKVYNKTTIDPLKGVKNPKSNKKKANPVKTPPINSIQPSKIVSYTYNKWIYFMLALFLGTFGAQYFYSGEKNKGIKSLLFCWTGIPTLIGLCGAVAILFKNADSNGNITKTIEKRASVSEVISHGNDVQSLLQEIEEMESTLKTTLAPSEYIATVKKISDHLNEITNFSRTYSNNTNFNSKSMASALQTMVNGLAEEETNFINRYFEAFQLEGQNEILKYKEYFSPEGLQMIERLYK